MSENSIAKTIFYDEELVRYYNTISNDYLHPLALDLTKAKQRLEKYRVGWMCLDSIIDLFPHLTLAEDHHLFLYISQEYHGLYGYIAAIPKNMPPEPLLTADFHRYEYREIVLPDTAAPPIQALYADGTPESYLETLYLRNILSKLPRPFDKYHTHCLYNAPKELHTKWTVYADIADWRPRLTYSNDDSAPMLVSVWVDERPIFGAAAGVSGSIKLCQHSFLSNPGLHYVLKNRNGQLKPYKTFIDPRNRYKDGHYCCDAYLRSIMIAQEIMEW